MKQIITLGIAVVFLYSCGKKDQTQQPPVKSYKVIEIEKTDATIWTEYPAVLQGIVDVEIRAKVDGYIEKILVEEGQEVRKGQLLFKLETQSASQDAEAAKANVEAAQVEVNRLAPLVERNIISDVQLQSAKARLANAKSMYQSILARINYANITSPVNGIVGTLPYRTGAYVNSQTAVPLTRISDISKIYAYFSVNEKQQLDMVTAINGKTFQEKITKIPPVKLILSNGKEYTQLGKIETFSGQANPQTGSFSVRAGFPNPEKLLRSGGSAVIQIPAYLKDVIVIPQKSTMELQDKRLALIVGDSSKVKAVPVKVRAVSGGQFFVVDEGLRPKDLVLVEGVGIVQEGTLINPTLTEGLKTTEKINN